MAIKVSDKRQRKRTKVRQTLSNYFPMSFKGWIVYVLSMLTACAMSTLMRNAPSTDVYVPLIFVLAVLITAIMTEGYFYGILASVTSVVAVNWAFTYPYMKINFSIYGYPLTFLTMLAVGCAVSTLTSRLKEQEKIKTESEREKTRANLLRAISHDLRTPLTAICGYLDLLEQEPHSENSRRYLAVIRERTETMRALTEELLQYSVVTSVPDALNREPVSVNDILEQSLADFYGVFSGRGIAPVIQMPEQPVIRTLDAAALRRVFGNILSNAAKYSDGDLTVSLTPEGTVTFTNHAHGLGRVQAERLFDRFFTVESANGSTGLGLSIARQLTEKMGGHISAEYEDESLCVRVTL